MSSLKHSSLAGPRPAEPLAARLRPRTLEEFLGQEHILGEGSLLRRAIEADALTSLILWGPPGSGKTSLARVIAEVTSARFEELSATGSGISDARRVIEAAERHLAGGVGTILFIDEIHRWSKAQQDALLPAVEEGRVTLIGATTENPYFEVNAPLISRCRILRLNPLSTDAILELLRRAVEDKERGYGAYAVELDPQAAEYLAEVAGGDARVALMAFEAAVGSLGQPPGGVVDLELAREAVGRTAILYDKDGDAHYDTISAFIKSLRGSDPDAALHWLAKMLEAGEDPEFVARRMVIFASEDVGLADLLALPVAVAAAQALQFVGLPEARLNLAHAAIYLATAPKSNSVISAIEAARKDVLATATRVPPHLRDSHYPGAKKLGHGKGYSYPHSYPGHWAPQEYGPPELRGRRYYRPSGEGAEGRRWEALKERKRKAAEQLRKGEER